jgi:hypothetical protein
VIGSDRSFLLKNRQFEELFGPRCRGADLLDLIGADPRGALGHRISSRFLTAA